MGVLQGCRVLAVLWIDLDLQTNVATTVRAAGSGLADIYCGLQVIGAPRDNSCSQAVCNFAALTNNLCGRVEDRKGTLWIHRGVSRMSEDLQRKTHKPQGGPQVPTTDHVGRSICRRGLQLVA